MSELDDLNESIAKNKERLPKLEHANILLIKAMRLLKDDPVYADLSKAQYDVANSILTLKQTIKTQVDEWSRLIG